MNWYKTLKISMIKLASEWWLDDSGTAMYADGDIGDMNHEAHVIQTVLSKYDLDYESSGVDAESAEFLDQFAKENLQACIQQLKNDGRWDNSWNKMVKKDPNTVAIQVGRQMTLEDILLIKGASEEEARIGAGIGDARNFAMKNWGWKAMRGDNIETWTLTQKDVLAIARGIGDTLEQDGSYDFENADENNSPTYNINVLSNGWWFSDIPYVVLESGNPTKLLPYKGGGGIGNIQSPTIIDQTAYNPYQKYEGD